MVDSINLYLTGGDIRFCIGEMPTKYRGILASNGEIIVLNGQQTMRGFKAINIDGDATLWATFFDDKDLIYSIEMKLNKKTGELNPHYEPGI